MSDDNVLNLKSRVVPIHSGNDQASSAGHVDDPPPTLPEIPETSERSAPRESTLFDLFGHIARMLETVKRTQMSLKRDSQAQGVRLDSV